MSSRRLKFTVTIENPQLVAAVEDRQRELSEDIVELLRPGMEALDAACKTVFDLGYRPDECEIVTELSSDGCSNKRTLQVLGRSCFEVTIAAKPIGPPDWLLDVETAPRLIAWPPALTR